MHQQDKEIILKIENETQINNQLKAESDELDRELEEIEEEIK